MPDQFVADDFTLDVMRRETHDDITMTHVKVRDRFTAKRHTIHRAAVRLFLHQLEMHLRARPQLGFDHPRNIVQRLVYLPPAVRSWAAYMPGAFATQPVHNPDTARLQDGTKLDYITKNLFRHSIDATGLRSRAYAMAWYVRRTAPATRALHWLSLASGTGRQTLDAASLLKKRPRLTLTDIDSEALAVAAKLAHEYKHSVQHVTTVLLDATDKQAVGNIMHTATPDVIDAMGLFEYLSDAQAVELIRSVTAAAQPNACFVFSNMRPTHPELQLHKRGVGWPGVIVRETHEVVALLRRAGVASKSIDIVLPDDNVYAVYCISAA
jgi:hypothetical protein